MAHKKEIEFYEIQRFRNPWIRFSIAALTIGFVIYFGTGAIRQLVYGEPWGTKPMSDLGLVLTGSIILCFMLGLCFFFFSLKLITIVTKEGLQVRLFPISRQIIPFQHILACHAVTFNPMKDFGGWGVRYSEKGKSYTLYGNRGVQLDLINNNTLLIGSQRAEELSECIMRHIK